MYIYLTNYNNYLSENQAFSVRMRENAAFFCAFSCLCLRRLK